MTRTVATAVAVILPALALGQSGGAAARSAARSWHQANETAVLAEFRELLSVPNVASDLPNIRRNAALLMEMLRKRGATARLLELDANTPPAVYGEYAVSGATRTLVFYAHYDGQPVDPRQWTGSGPFSPVLRDKALFDGGKDIPWPTAGQHADDENRIYARSTGDDKGSILAMLTALDALRAAKIAPSVNLKFFFEGEEEAGSNNLAAILAKYADLLKADAWLFCDGPVHQSRQQQIVFGTRGVTGLELTVYGPTRPLHSGHYGNWAPNPGALIANLLAGMRDDDGKILIEHYYDDVRPLTAAEKRALAQLPVIDDELRASLGLARTEAGNALLAERIMLPALNIRGIRIGGVQELGTNTINTEANASIDFRLVPNETPANVKRLVERHIESRGYHIARAVPTADERSKYPKIVRVQWGDGYPPNQSFMDHPLAGALQRAIADGAAQPPLMVPRLGGSGPDYLFTEVLKVPVAVLPIANHDNNQHAANENIRIRNIRDGIEMYAGLFARVGAEWRVQAVVP